MTKKAAVQESSDNDGEATRAESIKTAVRVAKELFKTDAPTGKMVNGLHDRVFLDVDDSEPTDDALTDMVKAYDVAKDSYGVESPDDEMVFGAFDRIFIAADLDA